MQPELSIFICTCYFNAQIFSFISTPNTIAADQGQIVFVSSSGELDANPSLTYDKDERTVKMQKFAADSFMGDSINFRGREIRNAHIVGSSIEGLGHLTVESLALRSSHESNEQGHGLALIDGTGEISKSSRYLRWDDDEKELSVPSLTSLSKSGLEIRSDVDFKSNQLKNVNIEANTTLTELVFKDGYIENSILHNVTASGLNLGDVALDSLTISQFDSSADFGSLLMVGEDGTVAASSALKHDKEGGHLIFNSNVLFTKSIDLNDQDVLNANIKSGSIDGNIQVSVDSIKAKAISLTSIRDDKTMTSNGLAVLDLDGNLVMGPIIIDERGSLGDMDVHGTIDFSQAGASGDASTSSRGEIKGASIVGGTAEGLEKLSVIGETELGLGLQVSGETFLDGSLTVSGSVLGSGPYVDVSDGRFKTSIESMDSSEVLEKILQLDGVSYILDLANNQHPSFTGNEESLVKQLGFIAQDVELLFPEVVSTDADDFKGIQYARFAPILVEGLKQLTAEVRALHEENVQLKLRIEEDNLVQFDHSSDKVFQRLQKLATATWIVAMSFKTFKALVGQCGDLVKAMLSKAKS